MQRLSCLKKLYFPLVEEKIMLDRDTGRPRGFGFVTYADRRGMDEAIREMDGRDLGDRPISVNKAQPRMGGDDDSGHGYSGGGRGRGRGTYRPSGGEDECYKCGRSGHWARDCPSGGGIGGSRFSPPPPRFGGGGGRSDRFGGDRDRYMDDRYDGGRYGNKDRFDSRDGKYGGRDRYVSDRYSGGGGDRYGGSKGYDREGGPRGGNDRYVSGGPTRTEGRSYRKLGPYDRPTTGGRPSSFDRY